MHVGISAAGHYLSEDDRNTFAASNNGLGAGFVSDPYTEFGQCVHKTSGHPDALGHRCMQNHGRWDERPGISVLRSDDDGDRLRLLSSGLPLDFDFPVVVHPHEVDMVYVVPLEDWTLPRRRSGRVVQRKRRRLTSGLPKKNG